MEYPYRLMTLFPRTGDEADSGVGGAKIPKDQLKAVPEENPPGPQGVSLQSERTDEAERTLPRGADPHSENYYRPLSSSGMARTG